MDEGGFFFKTLPTKGLAKNRKKATSGKGSKQMHLEILVAKYNDIKVVFPPKNTTSHLQPLNAGLIQSF